MMVTFTSDRQWLQQAALEPGEDLAADIILALEELDDPASTKLSHALRLAASSFNFLSEKHGRRLYQSHGVTRASLWRC